MLICPKMICRAQEVEDSASPTEAFVVIEKRGSMAIPAAGNGQFLGQREGSLSGRVEGWKEVGF